MGSHQDYKDVMQLVFDGKLVPAIYKTFSLEEGIKGMALIQQGEQFGKIVVGNE